LPIGLLMKRGLSIFVFSVGILAACSTTPKVADEHAASPISPPIPDFLEVSHPTGYGLADVKAIFLDSKAPSTDSLKGCDQNYMKLSSLTPSEEERLLGARELVRTDPVSYHWCFYGKILELEDKVKTDSYIDQKQTDVLKAYAFLVPIARGFLSEYKDSRYLRWAVKHYRNVSDAVFYRRLEMTPEMTSELVLAFDPFPSNPVLEITSVLAKYKIVNSEASAVPVSSPTSVVAPASPSPVSASSAIDPNELPFPEPTRDPASAPVPEPIK